MIVTVVKTAPTTIGGNAVADFADYLKADLAAETAVITLCWNAALEYVDGIGWANICNKVATIKTNEWNDGEFDIEVEGITSAATMTVTYFDSANVSQTLTLASDEKYIEQTGIGKATINITLVPLPEVYERSDAITIVVTIAGVTGTDAMAMIVYQIGAYFYECRVNEKEPQMTVVEKLAIGLREKVY